MSVIYGIIILLAQNLIRLAPSYKRGAFDYTGSHGLKIKCPYGSLDFLRTWYNNLIQGRKRPNGHPYRDCGAIMV